MDWLVLCHRAEMRCIDDTHVTNSCRHVPMQIERKALSPVVSIVKTKALFALYSSSLACNSVTARPTQELYNCPN